MSYLDVRKSIFDYIKKFNISYKNIEALISCFLNKTLKKIERNWFKRFICIKTTNSFMIYT